MFIGYLHERNKTRPWFRAVTPQQSTPGLTDQHVRYDYLYTLGPNIENYLALNNAKKTLALKFGISTYTPDENWRETMVESCFVHANIQ